MQVKTNRFAIALLSGAILAAIGCTVPQPGTAKTMRKVTVDISPFIEAGCVKEENNVLNCSKIGLEQKFGCSSLNVPSDALGGLAPKVAIAECNFINTNTGSDGITRKGCRLPLYNKYIVFTDSKDFKLLSNKEEFANYFAAADTPEKALAFAVALTRSTPRYNIKVPKEYRVFVDKIEDTSVNKIEGGYQVRLFDYQLCGCGPHSHFAVDYKVSETGEVSEISRTKIYEDPQKDGLCVD